jgi:cyclic beta-1,2-glucan synthetase
LLTADTPGPRTHLLSNGDYTVLVTNAGSGFSTCRGLDVTRWREDRTRDAWGQFLYLRDLHSREVWSAAHHPVGRRADRYEVIYSTDKAEFLRHDLGIDSHLEVTVSPERNVEVRRLTLTNTDTQPRLLEATSYAEVVLGPHGADLAHPGFGKLFLETEWLPNLSALLCHRRPRSPEQKAAWAVHVLASDATPFGLIQYETDRARFLGRRRTPASWAGGAPPPPPRPCGRRPASWRARPAPCSTRSSACASRSGWRRARASRSPFRQRWPTAGKRPWPWPTSTTPWRR